MLIIIFAVSASHCTLTEVAPQKKGNIKSALEKIILGAKFAKAEPQITASCIGEFIDLPRNPAHVCAQVYVVISLYIYICTHIYTYSRRGFANFVAGLHQSALEHFHSKCQFFLISLRLCSFRKIFCRYSTL